MISGPAALAVWISCTLASATAAESLTILSRDRLTAEVIADAGGLLAARELDAGVGHQPVMLATLRVSTGSAAQALAQALGLWWHPVEGGGFMLGTTEQIPPARLTTRSYPGTGSRPLLLEAAVRRVMQPWLSPGCGVAVDPLSGIWSATLDADGHARLLAVLSTLDDATARIPAWIIPDPPAGNHQDLDLPWNAWPAALVEAGCPAVAIAPSLRSSSAPFLAAGSLATIPERLRIPSAWIDGVLCIGDPRPRLHPAYAAQVAVLPVAHLRRPAADLAPMVARMVGHLEYGWGALPHPTGASLVVVADPATIHWGMDLMDMWERDPGLVAP